MNSRMDRFFFLDHKVNNLFLSGIHDRKRHMSFFLVFTNCNVLLIHMKNLLSNQLLIPTKHGLLFQPLNLSHNFSSNDFQCFPSFRTCPERNKFVRCFPLLPHVSIKKQICAMFSLNSARVQKETNLCGVF